MRLVTNTILVVLMGALFPATRAGFDTKKLEGDWTIVSGKRDGKPIPADEIKGARVTFTKDQIVGTDKDKKRLFAATYTVDDTTKPYTLRMTGLYPKRGEKAEGVIEVSGDTAKLCYNLPGGKPARNFEAGEKQHCFVLKKAR